ncbi:hypothetical protein OG444_18170 [Streptomyces sp. NBC_01232]|uniref:hypothetical protein n=1 Tax=Streptomyces sp. NBC_01232 TaxID=2903786 RepID=UPI002E140FD7|nr:hypothetical protein OG444_18170 [Streptomyces sp. NBC_01232]
MSERQNVTDAVKAGTPEPAVPAEPAVPEAAAPEAVAPEAVAPEAVVPEGAAPEAVAPEPVAAEQAVPEPAVAPAVVPEAVAAEPIAPEPVVPEAAVAPVVAPEAVQEPAPARRANRRTVRLVAAAVGAVVLVGAGLGAAAALGDADRTAPTRYWLAEDAPVAEAGEAPSVPANELQSKLLPLPKDYWLGPDVDAEGNNYFISGERALQIAKEDHTGLSGDERAERDKALSGLKLKGVAGRSYARRHGAGASVVEIQLMQADPQQLAQFGEFSKKILSLVDADGKAPKVDGFPDAKCMLTPLIREKDEKIDALDCLAVQGDVMVSFRVYGSGDFLPNDAAALFKEQLNHLKSPGESA